MLQSLRQRLCDLSTPTELPMAPGERRRKCPAGPQATAGAAAEHAAVHLLRNKGYRVLCRNRVNRCGELDIVAQKGELVVFAEVRSRRMGARVGAKDALTADKRRAMARTIELFRRQHGLYGVAVRVDLIAVTIDKDGSPIDLEHVEGIAL